MGVDRKDYIVYGWKLPYDSKNKDGEKINNHDEKFLPYIEGHKGVKYSLIVDGMSCSYKVFGKVITDDTYEGWDFLDLNVQNIDFDRDEMEKEFKELFNIDEVEDPKLFIFSHYK